MYLADSRIHIALRRSAEYLQHETINIVLLQSTFREVELYSTV